MRGNLKEAEAQARLSIRMAAPAQLFRQVTRRCIFQNCCTSLKAERLDNFGNLPSVIPFQINSLRRNNSLAT